MAKKLGWEQATKDKCDDEIQNMCSKYKHLSKLSNEQISEGLCKCLKKKIIFALTSWIFFHFITDLKSWIDNMHDSQLTHWMRNFPIRSDPTGAIVCEVKIAHNRATNTSTLGHLQLPFGGIWQGLWLQAGTQKTSVTRRLDYVLKI